MSQRPSVPSGPKSVSGSEDSPRETTSANAIDRDTIAPHRSSPADREQRISDAAYRRAEQRGFAPGAELDDWLDAEREIDDETGAGTVG